MSASLFTVVPTVGRSRLRLLVLSAVKAVGLNSIAAASEAAAEATEATSSAYITTPAASTTKARAISLLQQSALFKEAATVDSASNLLSQTNSCRKYTKTQLIKKLTIIYGICVMHVSINYILCCVTK